MIVRRSLLSELGMLLDIGAHPWLRADSRVRQRELRSRSRRECDAGSGHDVFDAVPRSLGTPDRQIAISLHSVPNRSQSPCLQRTHSRNFRFDREQLSVRQRPGRPRLHFRAQRLIPVQPAQPSLAMGQDPSTRRPHWYRGRWSLFLAQLFPAHLPQPAVDRFSA